jgi:hypothetical protein
MMLIRPRSTITSEALIRALGEATGSLSRSRGTAGGAFERLNAYLAWVNEQVRQFARMIWPEDIDRLFMTRRYWVLQSMDPASHSPILNDLLNLEYDERARDLEDAHRDLDREIKSWWSRPGHLVLPDTNVLSR